MRAAEADARSFSRARRCIAWNSVPDAWNSRDSFCWVYFWDACLQSLSAMIRTAGFQHHTLKSSHVVNFLTPSPTSLNPSLASSKRSCTLSLTLSVSRFVPRRFSCCDRRPILDVKEKSCSERLSLNRLNSGSSRYSGSSLRR